MQLFQEEKLSVVECFWQGALQTIRTDARCTRALYEVSFFISLFILPKSLNCYHSEKNDRSHLKWFCACSRDHLERAEWSRDVFTGLGLAIALVMAVYQVKVYYGTDFHKCGTFFPSTEDFSFYGFITRVKDITKTFHDPSTLCRLLLLFSSFYTWSRLDHYWSNVHQRDHRSGCLLKRFIVMI